MTAFQRLRHHAAVPSAIAITAAAEGESCRQSVRQTREPPGRLTPLLIRRYASLVRAYHISARRSEPVNRVRRPGVCPSRLLVHVSESLASAGGWRRIGL